MRNKQKNYLYLSQLLTLHPAILYLNRHQIRIITLKYTFYGNYIDNNYIYTHPITNKIAQHTYRN